MAVSALNSADAKRALKRLACEAIDNRRAEIIEIGEELLRNPETGFEEIKSAKLVAQSMNRLGLSPQAGLAITGVKGRVRGGKPGPRVAIIGELDSLRTPGHAYADPVTGAAHSCGHNAQIAAMLGSAMGLIGADAFKHLAGEVIFFAVPAEEFIDIGRRLDRVERGELEFMLGKPELVAKGHFDDVDMAMMIHLESKGPRACMFSSSNGAVVKHIRFVGRSAHAGTVPQLGINALNAAVLALQAIALLRETFWEKDTIRIHPIITKGGDAVSAVPADVRVETFVRGGSVEAILEANRKVDRCLRAAAWAIGADVEIQTIPGYLPQRNNEAMGRIFGDNADFLWGSDDFELLGHRTGSTDMGDLGHLFPVIHPYVRGACGVIHGSDWRIASPEDAYVNPAKLLAMTAIDLLFDDANPARTIVDQFLPVFTRDEYLELERGIFRREYFSAGSELI